MKEIDILVNYVEQYKDIKQKYYKYKKLNDNIFVSWIYKNKFKKIEHDYKNITNFIILNYINKPMININPIQDTSYSIPIAQKVEYY